MSQAWCYPPVNKHRPWQIGVGRLVSTKNWWFSGSMLIYQMVSGTYHSGNLQSGTRWNIRWNDVTFFTMPSRSSELSMRPCSLYASTTLHPQFFTKTPCQHSGLGRLLSTKKVPIFRVELLFWWRALAIKKHSTQWFANEHRICPKKERTYPNPLNTTYKMVLLNNWARHRFLCFFWGSWRVSNMLPVPSKWFFMVRA